MCLSANAEDSLYEGRVRLDDCSLFREDLDNLAGNVGVNFDRYRQTSDYYLTCSVGDRLHGSVHRRSHLLFEQAEYCIALGDDFVLSHFVSHSLRQIFRKFLIFYA